MVKEIKNYAWPVTAISKEDYKVITDWAKEQQDTLQNKQIVIFGAGIRGAEIAVILKSVNVTNIVFTDNNPEKWGGVIDDYPIVSLETAFQQKETSIYLISVEEGDSICNQLEKEGLIINKTYFYPKADLYRKFIEEYKRPMNREILVMGDCMFEVVAFDDENKDSLTEIMQQKLGISRVKHLTMHGMSLPGFYHILKGQINCGMIPGMVVLMLNFETLTGKQHLLPRSQHTKLIKAIYELSPDPDGELENYVKVVEERVKNIQAEFFTSNKYSSKKNNNNQQGLISDSASKVFFKLNYMYNLDTEMESLQYLRKIMKMAKEYQFGLIPFVPPVNYERGCELFGKEMFEQAFSNNIFKLNTVISENGFELLDLSHVCPKEEFAHVTTPDETTNYEGRLHVAECIIKRIEESKR